MGDSKLIDSMIHDGLWDVYNDVHMGTTGETVAKECNIDRETMDAFAARSQQRAAEAWKNGWFDWETFPVDIPQRRGDPLLLTTDEGVRGNTTAQSLAGLRPVFDKDGTVTAGNASTLNDGASAVLIAEAEFAKEQGWEILASIEDYCTSGVEPARVMGALTAVKTLLERNNLDVLDVDVYEHNEAFASASCAVAQEVGIPEDRFNLHGGAVSLGHHLVQAARASSRCWASCDVSMRPRASSPSAWVVATPSPCMSVDQRECSIVSQQTEYVFRRSSDDGFTVDDQNRSLKGSRIGS